MKFQKVAIINQRLKRASFKFFHIDKRKFIVNLLQISICYTWGISVLKAKIKILFHI